MKTGKNHYIKNYNFHEILTCPSHGYKNIGQNNILSLIASPKGEADNRKRRKKSHVTYSVCMYVPLHSSGVLRQISDFLVLKIRQKICGAIRKKIISFI
jgi:hypothetical protein